MARVKLKKIEEYLQDLDDFTRPKVLLEQYSTPAHIAAQALYAAQSNFGDLEGGMIADLGSGCGRLSVGCFLLGAGFVLGFEIDEDAIETFRGNVEEMEIPNVDCVQCDVTRDLDGSRFEGMFDAVVLNPPFGTKHNAGIDMKFLQVATKLSRGSIYSLHKSSTRDYVRKKATDWDLKSAEVVAELRFDLPASYRFHKKQSVDVEVDFWRFEVK